MPDPLSPHDIARRSFDVARRGYEQQAVRAYLHEISSLVERLQRREVELRERAERAETRVEMAERPDEATLIEVLGEETTRVLTSARESAAEIRSKAEAAAARVIDEATKEAAEIRGAATRDADARLAEATAESERLLEEARTELDRRRAEADELAAEIRTRAETDAEALREAGQAAQAEAREAGEAEREAARQEGRRMVAEAQAVRERVLRDLAARRKRARVQVEKLNAGRERLLEAYAAVRRTADEATNELSHALVDARLAADAAARRVEDEPEPSIEQLDAEVAQVGRDLLPDEPVEGPAEEPSGEDHRDELDDDDSPGPFSGEVPAVDAPPPPAPGEEAADDAAAVAPESGEPEPPVASPAEDGPRTIALDPARGRKRRKKGFDGLPPAPLTVVEPPAEAEGVRILAEPAAGAPADAPTAAAEPESAQAGTEPGSDADAAVPDAAEAGAPGAAAAATEIPESPAAGAAETVGDEASADVEETSTEAAAEPTEAEAGEVEAGEVGAGEVEAGLGEVEAGSEVEASAGASDGGEGEGPAVDAGPDVSTDDELAGDGAAGADEISEADDEPLAPADAVEAAAVPDGAASEAEDPARDAADVFARLRAEAGTASDDAGESDTAEPAAAEEVPAAGEPAGADAHEPGAEPPDDGAEAEAPLAEDAPFRARAAAIEAVERDLGRRLKRTLADEQNEVLDLLRRAKPKGVDDVLPVAEAHLARWGATAAEALVDAATAGADWSGAGRPPGVDDLAEDLGRTLTAPLRERIDRCFAAADGNLDEVADRVRALYREWKGQRLTEVAADAIDAAYARGVLHGVADGAEVRWVVDPSAGPCPDCDDNVLGGAIAKGEAFPTGNANAPAHPGCHCLVLPVES